MMLLPFIGSQQCCHLLTWKEMETEQTHSLPSRRCTAELLQAVEAAVTNVPQKSGSSHSTLQIKEELWQGSFPLLEMTDIPHAASPAKDLSLSLMCSSCLLTICCGHRNMNDFLSYFAMHRSIWIYSAVCLSSQLSYICIKSPTAIEPEGPLCKTDRRTEVLVDLRDEGMEEQRWAGCVRLQYSIKQKPYYCPGMQSLLCFICGA